MMLSDYALPIMAALVALLAMMAVRTAYRNGLRDGYGYAKDPVNADYHKAGKMIRKWQRQQRQHHAF